MINGLKDAALTQIDELFHPMPEYPSDIGRVVEYAKLCNARSLRGTNGRFQDYTLELYGALKEIASDMTYADKDGAMHWNGRYLPALRAISDVFEDNKMPVYLVDLPESERSKIGLGRMHSILQFDGTYTLQDGDEVCVMAMKKKGALDLRKKAVASTCGVAEIDKNSEGLTGDVAIRMDYRTAIDIFSGSMYEDKIAPNKMVHLPVGIRSIPTGMPKPKQANAVPAQVAAPVVPPVQQDVEIIADELGIYGFKRDDAKFMAIVDDVMKILGSKDIVMYKEAEDISKMKYIDHDTGLPKVMKKAARKAPKRRAAVYDRGC